MYGQFSDEPEGQPQRALTRKEIEGARVHVQGVGQVNRVLLGTGYAFLVLYLITCGFGLSLAFG